jgi:hypothetical protein
MFRNALCAGLVALTCLAASLPAAAKEESRASQPAGNEHPAPAAAKPPEHLPSPRPLAANGAPGQNTSPSNHDDHSAGQDMSRYDFGNPAVVR